MRFTLLCLFVFAACKTPAPPAPNATHAAPNAQDELTALLKSIPVECVAPLTAPPVECPVLVPPPPGACVVERFDLRSGRKTDRLVYLDGLLRSAALTLADNANEFTEFHHDAARRLSEKTTCFSAGPGEPGWSPSWRPPFAVYEHPMQERTRTTLTYEGDAGVPSAADVTSSTSGVEGYQLRICYRYAEGRRARRVQTFRGDATTLQTQVRNYVWTKARLDTIELHNLALRGTSVVRRNDAKVTFSYGPDEQLRSFTAGPSSTQFTWDTKGRLATYGTVVFEWNDRDQLAAAKFGDPTLDGRFAWDEGGRIEGASFANGDGYRVAYGAACPRDFRAAGVTPSVDPFLSYEGKDAL